MKVHDFAIPPGAKVDIVVRAKNGHEMTEVCIASIVQNTPRELYRLILVDDGSEPHLDCWADIAVRCDSSSGAVTASNLGIAISQTRRDSQYCLILDNDTQIPNGDSSWLQRMIAELEESGPACACVGATTSFANPPQHALTVPQTYTHDWGKPDERNGQAENPQVPWFVSFAVLFRKQALKEVGFWDERYNPGNFEDTDYSVRLREAGWGIKVARSVYIHHLGHQTFRDELKQLLATNGEKFTQKWGLGRLMDLGFITKDQMKAALR